MRALEVVAVLAMAAMAIGTLRAAQCGSQAGGATCPNCLCCSRFGWCGSTPEYCGDGCQSHCSGCGSTPVTPYPFGGVSSIVSRSLFNQILLHRNAPACQAKGFYPHDVLVKAAAAFPYFGPIGHAVITGQWIPSGADLAAGWAPRFGMITNTINSGIECGHGHDNRVADRIGFYKRYCNIFGIGYGGNLDCYKQSPFI